MRSRHVAAMYRAVYVIRAKVYDVTSVKKLCVDSRNSMTAAVSVPSRDCNIYKRSGPVIKVKKNIDDRTTVYHTVWKPHSLETHTRSQKVTFSAR